MDEIVILGQHTGPRGEVMLRRRSGPDGVIEELIVNGAFAMDSAETATEQHLGALATRRGGRILVGGLGLGYTVSEILGRADAAGTTVEVEVAEIEQCLIDWARAGLTGTLARVVADPRVRLEPADVRRLLERPGPGYDAIVLDVDNGPDFLIHADNAELYAASGLRTAYGRLAPGGLLAIWCQGPSDPLAAELARLGGEVERSDLPVRRGRHQFDYAIYGLRRT